MSELSNTSVTPASRQSATITTPISAASSQDQVLAPLQCGAMRHAPDGRKVRKILMERTSTVLLLGGLVRKDSYPYDLGVGVSILCQLAVFKFLFRICPIRFLNVKALGVLLTRRRP